MATWGSQRLAQASLRIDQRLRAVQLLQGTEGDWCVYWQGKASSPVIVGIGAIATFDELPPLDTDHWGWTLFGGIPFDDGRLLEPIASDMTKTRFWLPRHEWRLTDDAVTLTVRVVAPDHIHSMGRDPVLPLLLDEVSAAMRRITRTTEELGPLPLPTKVEDFPDYDHWCAAIQRAQSRMVRHDLEKVVLGRCQILTFQHPPAFTAIIQGLSQLQEPSYLIGMHNPDGVSFISRSPEKLLSWQGSKIDVDAIAGTGRRSDDVKEDMSVGAKLSLSPKELSEHRAVSDYVRETLTPFCVKFEQVEKERLLLLKNVQHLYSRFTGQCGAGHHPIEILKALHPTPAVGGRPKDQASLFLAAVEGIERGWFGGAVGWTDGYEGNFAIGIRAAYLEGARLTIFAGAGIMAESDPDAEWRETRIKMKNFNDLFKAPERPYEQTIDG